MPGLLFALLQIALAAHAAPSHTHAAPPSAAIANENRVAAGRLGNGVLTLNLEAREALQRQIAGRLGFRLVDHRMELYGVRLDSKTSQSALRAAEEDES